MSRTPSGTAARVSRPVPANLSHPQRRALEQFLAGQISAGALSAKLEQAESAGPPPDPHWRPAGAPGRASGGSPRRRRLAVPAALASGLLLASVCTLALASASTSAERPVRTARRAARHRVDRRTSQMALISETMTSTAPTVGRVTAPPPRHAHNQTPPGWARRPRHGRGASGVAGTAPPKPGSSGAPVGRGRGNGGGGGAPTGPGPTGAGQPAGGPGSPGGGPAPGGQNATSGGAPPSAGGTSSSGGSGSGTTSA